jgi:hypothetical protein
LEKSEVLVVVATHLEMYLPRGVVTGRQSDGGGGDEVKLEDVKLEDDSEGRHPRGPGEGHGLDVTGENDPPLRLEDRDGSPSAVEGYDMNASRAKSEAEEGQVEDMDMDVKLETD